MRSSVYLAVVICLAGILTSTVATAAPETETVDIQLRWHHQFQFAGYYAALEKGYYQQEGLNVRLHAGDPQHRPIAEVLAGRAQYAAGNSEVLYQRLQGKPLVALAAIFQHSPSVLLTLKDSGIDTVHELVGKKVMLINRTEDADFLTMFQNEGVSLAQVDIIPSSYNLNDLVTRKIAAFNSYSTNEPYFLKQRHIAYNIIDPSNYRIDFYSDILFTSESELKNHPKRVEAMRRATLKGWRYAMDHPEEIIDLLVNQYHVEKTRDHLEFEAAEMRKLIFPDLIEIGHMNPGRWQHMADAFVKAGLVKPNYSLDGFIYDTTPKHLPVWVLPILLVALLVITAVSSATIYLLRLNRRLANTQHSLRQSEERLRLAMAAAREGWFDLDIQTGSVLVAPEYARLLGYDPMEFNSSLETWMSSIHADDRPAVMAAFAASMKTREASELNYRRQNKSGDWIWLNSIGKVVEWDEQGKPLRMIGVHIDITARKLVEAELEQYRHHLESLVQERTVALSIAKEAAETASRAKSTFLANMSHELRTPMNAIMGMTSIALRRAEDPKLRDQLGKIDNASKHLLGVINDILDISKIEAERLTLEQVDFRLGEVVENVMSLIGPKAREKSLSLRKELPADVLALALRGDPLRLGQIFLNLAGNAVKFTDTGSITLQVHLIEDRPDNARLLCEVRDSGIGIPQEDQGRLFTAFEQADGSMTRKYGGTGLGLAISKRLAHLMGGEIGVNSVAGQGSTFWFTVCLAKATDNLERVQVVAGLSAEQQLRDRHAGARVLLAEDEPVNQEVSRGLIEDVGLAVELAIDGSEALALAQVCRYDLILMDMQMPNLNGLDATRAIRANSLNRDTPILAMTANAFDEDRRTCLAAGMNDHIGKPVDPERLYETLLCWLEQPHDNVVLAATRQPDPVDS